MDLLSHHSHAEPYGEPPEDPTLIVKIMALTIVVWMSLMGFMVAMTGSLG